MKRKATCFILALALCFSLGATAFAEATLPTGAVLEKITITVPGWDDFQVTLTDVVDYGYGGEKGITLLVSWESTFMFNKDVNGYLMSYGDDDSKGWTEFKEGELYTVYNLWRGGYYFFDEETYKASGENYPSETITSFMGFETMPKEYWLEAEYAHDDSNVSLFDFEVKDTVHTTLAAENGISVLLNGEAVEFDQQPVIEAGRTLVPLRAIFEAMGAEVDWDQTTRTVTAELDDVNISLTIDSNILVRNDEEIELDVPAKIVGGRTLVPVRAIAESFGAKVDWVQATRTVTIEF